eukprot:s1949_g14.t1
MSGIRSVWHLWDDCFTWTKAPSRDSAICTLGRNFSSESVDTKQSNDSAHVDSGRVWSSTTLRNRVEDNMDLLWFQGDLDYDDIQNGCGEGNLDLTWPESENVVRFHLDTDTKTGSPKHSFQSDCISKSEPLVCSVGSFEQSHLFPQSSHESGDEVARVQTAEISQQCKKVTFAEKVEVTCFFENDATTFTLDESHKDHFLRVLWHLNGQHTTWNELQRVVERIEDKISTRTAQDPAQTERLAHFGLHTCESIPQPVNVDMKRPEFAEDLWFAELLRQMPKNSPPISRRYVDTWFLSKHRFHVSIQPRRVAIRSDQTVSEFEQACREAWHELDNGDQLTFHLVHPKPPSLPSTVAHIIVIQGLADGFKCALYNGQTLPILRKLRAVLYEEGCDVTTFFRAAQHPEICNRQHVACYVRFHAGDVMSFQDGHEELQAPNAAMIEGDVRAMDLESNANDDNVDEDDITTTVPSDAESGSDDDEQVVLMSSAPVSMQFDHENPYPWMTDGFDQPAEDEILQAEHEPIEFAHLHEGYLMDIIEHSLEEDDDTPWTAVTFGLGLVDLGRRDLHFDPRNIRALLDDILRVWEDHAAYGDLVIYTVHPQPSDVIGTRAVALLVVIDFPEAHDDSIRHVLVIEQSAADVTSRPQPYGARLTSEASERELFAQLHLQANCPPFALRPCYIRLGEIMMIKDQHYEFQDGTLCRTWIGNVYEQVNEAENTIQDAEKFFLQVQSLIDMKGLSQQITCRIHGITPRNQPMGSRDTFVDTEWIYDLEWIQRIQALWPFDMETSGLFFVGAATSDMRETDHVVFHFIIQFGGRFGIPILVHQQLVAVDEMVQDTNGANEFWAIAIPEGEVGTGVAGALQESPFWMGYARTQNVYPHYAVNGVRLIDVRGNWRQGDLLRARFLVWNRHHILTLMLGTAMAEKPPLVEHTSFLQLRSWKYDRTRNDDVPTISVFAEYCDQVQQAIHGWQEQLSDRVEVDDTALDFQDNSSALSLDCCKEDNTDLLEHVSYLPWVVHENVTQVTDSCQDDAADNVSIIPPTWWSPSQDQSVEDTHVCPEQSEDITLQSATQESPMISSLQVVLQELTADNWQGLNIDFTPVPDMHPFAQIACNVVPVGTHGNVFHVFSDGSCRKGKAAWAFALLCETVTPVGRTLVRIGYAAGSLNESIGKCQMTALDAEATGIVAAAEYLLSKSHLPQCEIYFHYDATAVGHGSTGKQRTPVYAEGCSDRQKAARLLVSLIQAKAESVHGIYTRAHDDNPWNECADSIAGHVCCGWVPPITAQLRSGNFLHHSLREWAWIEINPTEETPSLSTMLQNRMQEPRELHCDATLQQAQDPLSLQSGHDVDEMSQDHCISKMLTMATANVGSMDYGTDLSGVSIKTQELLKQFCDAEIHFIGIQESRARKTQYILQGPFARYIAAGTNGQAGVELWINVDAMNAIFPTRFHPQKDAAVWFSSDRILAVRLQMGRVALEVIVAYAPQRGRPQNEVREWWDHFQQTLERRDKQALLFILGDMNCSIGSVEGPATGAHAYDVEDESGQRFREICENNALIIPSTFSELHYGPTDTHIGTRGHGSRIDFIAAPAECHDGVTRSYVNDSIDLMNGDKDHLTLCLELTLTLRNSANISRITKKNLYNRNEARSEKLRTSFCLLRDTPSIAWETDVNEHWGTIREHLQQSAVTKFPCQKHQQRQLYFSPETWQKLCDRKGLRQQYRQLQRCQTWTLLKGVLHSWKEQAAQQTESGYWRMQRVLLWQQEACLYEQRLRLDKEFKTLKRQSWTEWVKQQLEQRIQKAGRANASELYQILKPKQMIEKANGRLIKALPGFVDETGMIRRNRDEVALSWQAQFSNIENAEEISLDELMSRSQPQHREVRQEIDLLHIPTVFQLEEAIRNLNEQKAAGVDAIGPELFQADPATAARRLHPLLMKAALRGQGIIEMCGGWLLPFWKKRGNQRHMSGFRGILLEPTIARAFSRSWRPQLLQGLLNVIQPMQWGGRQGLSVDALHLHVHMWRKVAKAKKLAQATIFVDIRAAFYSVVKQIVAGTASGMQALRTVFDRMKLPTEMFATFEEHMENNNLVLQATKSSITAQSVAAMLGHTWFCIPDSKTLLAPMTGSRPGDPNADAMFSFVLAKILKDIQQRASQRGIYLLRQTESGVVSDMVTWVDDIAVSITSQPDHLLSKVLEVMHIIHDSMLEHGLGLSFGGGKTAVMFAYHGKGSVKARQQVDELSKNGIPLLSEYAPGLRIPVVAHYKHLGGHIARSGTRLPELRIRTTAALAKLRPLRRILTHEGLDVSKRSQLIKSLGLSVFSLHASTMYDLTQGEFTCWQAGLFKIYQTILPRNKCGEVQHWSMYQLANLMQAPMAMESLYLHRLRLLVHLIRCADPWMISMILHEHTITGCSSWLQGIFQALKWARTQVGDEAIPDELFQLHEFSVWQWFQSASKELKQVFKKVEKSHLYKVQTFCALQEQAKRQDDILRDIGWTLDPQFEATIEEHSSEVHACAECGAQFLQASSLAVHQQRKHGRRVALRRFVTDAACRACGKWFNTRPRALKHMQTSQAGCWMWHMRKYQPLSMEAVYQLDEKDRCEGVAVHQHGLRSQQQDMSWRYCTEDEMKDRLSLQPSFQEKDSNFDDPTEEELQTWAQYGMLPPGQGGHQKTQRKPTTMTMHHVSRDLSMHEKHLHERVQGWTPNFDYVPLPLADGRKFFLILFAGHRRPGDLASWFFWLSDDIIPIPIDVAIDAHHGNVFNDKLWISLIHSKKVVGGHGGPPCETFSLARWIECDNGTFPRPLRTTEQPWGCDERTDREVRQTLVGSLLMFRTLYLLVLIYAFGGSFTLEHPAGCGGQDHKWSIWESSFIAQLLLAGDIRRWTILQGPLGQPFPKPTNLLAGRLASLGLAMYAGYNRAWKPTVRLGGRKADGRGWKTAEAKAYPTEMCRILAQQHLQHAESLMFEGWTEEPEGLEEALLSLSFSYDPYVTSGKGIHMKSDYHHCSVGISMHFQVQVLERALEVFRTS